MTRINLLDGSVLFAEEYSLENWRGAMTKQHHYVSSGTTFCKNDKVAQRKVAAI